jgi:NAD(P)-dependent dehydrogenase (short-subunit alcohol dehydrogenase family)
MNQPTTSEHPRAVLLTGAAGGVGRALTHALVGRGYLVYAAARRRDDPRLVDDPRVRSVELDVTDPDSVGRAAAEVAAAQEGRGLHGVVNNAGAIVQGPVELVAPADLRAQFDVNVVGPATVLGEFLPLLRTGRGRVVNISAATARVAVPMMGPISASKAALESLSDALRVELAPWGIPVSVIEPGAMDTAIFAKASAQAEGALAALPRRAAGAVPAVAGGRGRGQHLGDPAPGRHDRSSGARRALGPPAQGALRERVRRPRPDHAGAPPAADPRPGAGPHDGAPPPPAVGGRLSSRRRAVGRKVRRRAASADTSVHGREPPTVDQAMGAPGSTPSGSSSRRTVPSGSRAPRIRNSLVNPAMRLRPRLSAPTTIRPRSSSAV